MKILIDNKKKIHSITNLEHNIRDMEKAHENTFLQESSVQV